jgi:tetratricopeptide (TPR) repeat protein
MLKKHLLTWVITICMSAALIGCGGAEGRKAEYLSRGKKYFEEKNFDKAKVEFKNVLQIDPKTAKPYFYLGAIEESKQNWREAFGLYQKSAELDPNDLETKTKLAKFYLLAKDQEKAKALVAEITAATPADVEGRMLKAAIANIENDRKTAITELNGVVADHADRKDAYVVLALLHSQANDVSAARQILEKGAAANPGDASLLLALAKLELQQKNTEKAEEIIKQLIAAQPNELQHRALLANIYMNAKRNEDAEKVVREAIQQDTKDARRYEMLTELLIKTNQLPKAIEELIKASEANPDTATLRFDLASVYEKTGQAAKAEEVFSQIIKNSENKPDVLTAKNKLAQLQLAQGKVDDANKLIEDILKENPQDNQALLLQGKIALGRKDAQKAIASFRSILKDQPNSGEVLNLLAMANLLDGKPALAQENLEQAITAKPEDFSTYKRLIELLAKQKNYSLALDKLNDYLKIDAKNMEALNAKADLLFVADKKDEIEPVLQQMKSALPQDPTGSFRLGQLYLTQKKFEAAIAELEAHLTLAKNDYEGLKSLLTAYIEMGQPEKGLARIKKVIADNDKHPTAHQLLGLYYVNRKDETNAIKEFRQAIEINPKWPLAYVNLATLYQQSGKTDQAISVFEDALKVFPDDPVVLSNLATLDEVKKDYASAIKRYEQILAKKSDNLLAINNLVSLLTVDPQNAANMKRAGELVGKLEGTNQPAAMDTLGWYQHLTNQNDKALELMKKVTEQAPQEPIFQYHLGKILLAKADNAGAKEALKKAVDAGKPFIGLDDAKAALSKL